MSSYWAYYDLCQIDYPDHDPSKCALSYGFARDHYLYDYELKVGYPDSPLWQYLDQYLPEAIGGPIDDVYWGYNDIHDANYQLRARLAIKAAGYSCLLIGAILYYCDIDLQCWCCQNKKEDTYEAEIGLTPDMIE